MYYFMERMDLIGQSASWGSGNTSKLVSVCECTSRKTAYEEPIKFEIEGKPCDYYLVMNRSMISERFYTFLKQQALSGYKIRNAVGRNGIIGDRKKRKT